MPTILVILGWRFFFYANERHEPIHIHCRKGDAEAKYWLDTEMYEAVEAHAYNLSHADKRMVRRIIFDHFDYIVAEWGKLRSAMDKAHDVTVRGFRGTVLRLRVDGQEYEVEVAQHSRRLAEATPEERANHEVSPAGYGIHWPDLDEDLSIDGLIGARHECPRRKTAA